MKKKILVLMTGLLLMASTLFAADGDLIVEGNLGIGTQTPVYPLDITSTDQRALNIVTTKTGTGFASGALNMSVTDSQTSGTAGNINGMVLTYTHNGDRITNHVASSTQMTLSGSGTTTGDWGKVAQTYFLNFKGADGAGYNYTNTNAYAFALRASIMTGQTRTHYFRNIGGLQIIHNYDNSYRTLSADNLYGIIVGDISQYSSYGLDAVTNAGGIQINKQTDSEGGRITNLMGIWMNGDGKGADIVFGPNKETSIYSDAGHLYATDLNGYVSQISPHDPETGEWIFYSKNTKTGRVVRVNMEELVKDMEKLTGKKYLLESFVNDKKLSD